MALEATRTIRSSCLAVTFIARQFGVRINADFVENTLKKGSLTSPKEFNDFFLRQGILTKPRNTEITSLTEKTYLFPCVGIMKTGQALILIGTKKSENSSTHSILSIDPMDLPQMSKKPKLRILKIFGRVKLLWSPQKMTMLLWTELLT